jgi:hypothetical protein
MRGKAVLAERAFGTTAVSYTTLEPGLKAGAMQHVTLSARGLDDDYLIMSVNTTIGVGGLISASVELGAADMTLVRLLLKLKRDSVPELEWNENEVLDEVLDTSESIALTEGTKTVSGKSGPYLWDDEDSTWDYSVWG